jgi:hypothetical protein
MEHQDVSDFDSKNGEPETSSKAAVDGYQDIDWSRSQSSSCPVDHPTTMPGSGRKDMISKRQKQAKGTGFAKSAIVQDDIRVICGKLVAGLVYL